MKFIGLRLFAPPIANIVIPVQWFHIVTLTTNLAWVPACLRDRGH